jgi:hypothetical protein
MVEELQMRTWRRRELSLVLSPSLLFSCLLWLSLVVVVVVVVVDPHLRSRARIGFFFPPDEGC